MGEKTGISWTSHTFNTHWGCQRVSPACEFCYAESFAERVGHGKRLPVIWGGKDTERKFFGDKHWNEPIKWNRAAEKAGVRALVFCASMADVCEDRRDLDAVRDRLRELIAATPWLTWQLLTKRPEHIDRLLPHIGDMKNVWLGTTVESGEYAARRLPHLLAVHASVHFVSAEPLLEAVSFRPWLDGPTTMARIDQIIVGGESGPHARPFNPTWARYIIDECRATGTACFIKQMGSNCIDFSGWLKQAHGANPAEWPEELRVQQFPEVRP